MNILILGAGQVGSTTAAQLAKEENNDVTVVDINSEKLGKLSSKSDLRVIEGNASYPKTLKIAGADSADILIAVTSSDEVNMVACQVASTLFNTQTKIARIRAAAYTNKPELFSENNVPVDFAISPEDLITDYIIEVIQHPGAFQVLDFAEGKIRMVGVKTKKQGFLVDNPLNRYVLGSMKDMTFNKDGSLDIFIQNKAPENMESNWLPSPGAGVEFTLTFRMYWPGEDVLNKVWQMPGVEKME